MLYPYPRKATRRRESNQMGASRVPNQMSIIPKTWMYVAQCNSPRVILKYNRSIRMNMVTSIPHLARLFSKSQSQLSQRTVLRLNIRSSTQSIQSSLVEYIQENGRTYHKYKQSCECNCLN